MRILSGIQPTNILHIGNYFGALKPAVELQKEHDLTMLIVDLHAITVPQNPIELSNNIAFATAAYLAAGIDPKRATIVQQSRISAHAELGWIMQCVARMGEVERMIQFKDKAKSKGQNVSVGLFTYPVLQAADILLYDAVGVPVGEDQRQHIELARDLAERFNRDFGETFVIPKPMIAEHGAKLLGLDNPEKKMSKSSPTPKNYISLMDEADVIRKKIRSAVTDSEPTVRYDEARPGVANLLSILSLIEGRSVFAVADEYVDKGMKDLKDDVAEALIVHLTPLQAEIAGYLKHRDELEKVIAEGSARAGAIAGAKIAEVKQKMGLTLA
ncbi:MAG: tryptophan--tRNA ligase [Patescibacteria group bacterium]|jgi:tryptophanyl-tRNA synthetase